MSAGMAWRGGSSGVRVVVLWWGVEEEKRKKGRGAESERGNVDSKEAELAAWWSPEMRMWHRVQRRHWQWAITCSSWGEQNGGHWPPFAQSPVRSPLLKMAGNGNEGFNITNGVVVGRNGLAKIQTHKKQSEICHNDSTLPVKAQTIDELHSLQKKKKLCQPLPFKGLRELLPPFRTKNASSYRSSQSTHLWHFSPEKLDPCLSPKKPNFSSFFLIHS